MLESIKSRLAGFLRWHVTNPVDAMQRELVYQNIFDVQCRNRGLRNDFYAVGAAANYGLMYFLFRVFDEHQIDSVVEFGSGQTTLLIDRIKKKETRHVCYEHDAAWHGLLAPQLTSCDYRLRQLVESTVDSRAVLWYADVPSQEFDLMLIDGPVGTDRFSRFGCIELIRAQTTTDCLIVFDDSDRRGEQETAQYAMGLLKNTGRPIRSNQLVARKSQTVIAGGRFIGATYYY